MAENRTPQIDTSQERETRHLHLGLDYGTSYSKLIFRDYGAVGGEKSYIIRRKLSSPNSDFRFPSVVSLKNDKLYFGTAASRIASQKDVLSYYSLKARFAFPKYFYQNKTELPSGISVESLVVFYVLYLLVKGFDSAENYARKNRFEPKLGMKLGVPMSYMDNAYLRQKFSRVARKAFLLWKDIGTNRLKTLFKDGISTDRAKGMVRFVNQRDKRLPAPNYRSWIREEVAAAMIWSFYSPQIEARLYGAFDIGAATTNASFFRIRPEFDRNRKKWIKAGLGFYGSVALPPGVDAYGKTLDKLVEKGEVIHMRGRENEYSKTLKPEQRVRLGNVVDKIFKNCNKAFSRSFLKEDKQNAWESYPLILLGGGSLIDDIRDKLSTHVHQYSWGNPEIVDLKQPEDLFELDGRPADLFELNGQKDERQFVFLLVAYGLSYIFADVPEVKGPEDIGPFRPERPPINFIPHEEIYAK